ncbi:MAG: RNA polymerase sigma factor [Pyrinomonadaceae bacterium]
MNQTAGYELRNPLAFFIGAPADTPRDPDYALARAAAGGAMSSVGELYSRHSHRVYSLCLRMTHNPADAEDLTQEVFIQLLRKIGSFRGECLFTTWLHRITINEVLMSFRRVKRRREDVTEDIEAEESASHLNQHGVPPRVFDQMALSAALSRLPTGSRTVFVLYDVEGYTHEEVACMLGCAVGTSKSQLHKARMRLRRLLLLESGKPES